MSLHIVQLGSPRLPNEGIRIGTVRRPPRGIRKADYAKRDFFDIWMPLLSPSAVLVGQARSAASTAQWKRFVQQFRREMAASAPHSLLELLATLSHQTDFSVGCYCVDETRCHRFVLRELFAERGASLSAVRDGP